MSSSNYIRKSYYVAFEIMQICVDKIAISNFMPGLEKVLMSGKEIAKK